MDNVKLELQATNMALGAAAGACEKLIEENNRLTEELRELKIQIQIAIMSGETETDKDGWITAYNFKTGAIHRLLKLAKD